MRRLLKSWGVGFDCVDTTPRPDPVFADATGVLGIERFEVRDFLRNSHDLLVALALAGYDVPTIEIVPTDYPSLSNWQGAYTKTIRIDLTTPELTMELNDVYPDAEGQINPGYLGAVLRLYLEPLAIAGSPIALTFTEADVNAYFHDIADLVTEPLDDFCARKFLTSHRHRDLTYGDVVRLNLEQLIEMPGSVTLQTRVQCDAVGDVAALAKQDFFRELLLCCVTPMTMFLQRKLGDAAAEWFREERPLDELPPGALWLLNPDTWADGPIFTTAAAWDPDRARKSSEYLRETVARIYEALSRPAVVTDGEHGGQRFPVPQRRLYQTGLSFWHVSKEGVDLDHGAGDSTPWAAVLMQRLIFNLAGDVLVGVDTDDEDVDCWSPTGGNDLKTILTMEKQVRPSPNFLAPKHRAGRFHDRTAETLERCGFSPGAALQYASGVHNESLLTTILRLFQLGMFSVEHLIGEVADRDDAIEYDVVAEFEEPASYRLTLPDYVHLGIVITQEYGGLGYDLNRAVCWEYLPVPVPLSDRRLQRTREGLDADHEKAKLVIAAAPGIGISVDEWPDSVAVEIIRVQDVALVPPIGARIDTGLLTAPLVMGLADLVLPEVIAASPELQAVADAIAAEEAPPVVVVSRLRDAAKSKQGVSILYKGAGGKRWPGVMGEAQVDILLPETSGDARFAYHIEALLDHETRVIRPAGSPRPDGSPGTPSEVERVPVVRFRLVVYATANVEIMVRDSGIGMSGQNSVVEHHYFTAARTVAGTRNLSFENLAEIPPQGTALACTPDVNGDFIATWLETAPDGSLIDRRGVHGVAANPAPITAAQREILVDWATFFADMGIGMIPVVGDLVDIEEVLMSCFTGEDKWGRPITNLDRALITAGVLLPFVSATTVRAIKRLAPDAPVGWLAHLDDGS